MSLNIKTEKPIEPEISCMSQDVKQSLQIFVRESPETAIRLLEVENKVAAMHTYKTPMEYDDEVLRSYAMHEVIDKLKLDFKPDTLDLSRPYVKQGIIMMLNSIMSEEPAIKAENIKAYVRRCDDEKLSEHMTYLV